ncbi:MAG: UTP--glucose-1-phosphate uridylyltransferase [Lachnospiraceae bacterium]|nr:UTP--glucose-1-phosphate uridylyltransferase [Lachnospiraceae bacterium]
MDIRKMLQEQDQLQVLRFESELTPEEKQNLYSQLENVDFRMIRDAMQSADKKMADEIGPADTLTIAMQEADKETYLQAGNEALKQGKMAAVILAGGQGSRLGHDGPKGTVNVGITRDKYLFEILLENVRRNTDPLHTVMHVYIMTSDINHESTVSFFEEHDYFGYPKDHLHFFRQDMAPALDLQGKLLLETKSGVSLAPNGNGGWFRSLQRQGLVDQMKSFGVEWLDVVSVDSVLQNIGDPLYLGAALVKGMYCGAKVVSKVTPEEKVGASCIRNGHPSIVEYSELSDEMRYAKNPDGTYQYQYGAIVNYLFNIRETEKRAGESMPVHKAIKKISCLDESGAPVVPAEPNAIKMEYFIFDILEFFDSCLFMECIREDEFAPIKNASGVDSLESARKLYTARFGDIL